MLTLYFGIVFNKIPFHESPFNDNTHSKKKKKKKRKEEEEEEEWWLKYYFLKSQ